MRAVFASIIILLFSVGCGSVEDRYTFYDFDPDKMTTLYIPGLEDNPSPYGVNEWNCGLRAVGLIRDAAPAPWDAAALEQRVVAELPVRDAFGWEGMGTAEVVATAQRTGMKTRLNLSTGFEDLWDGIRAGFPSVLLIQSGTMTNGVTETRLLHWVPVVGVAQGANKARYLIVVALDDGTRQLLPESDFRGLVWWKLSGATEAMAAGSDVRPGTSIRLDTRHLAQ